MATEIAPAERRFDAPSFQPGDPIGGDAPGMLAGRRLPSDTGELLDGAHYIVDFCDPSPTTALHAGYLRNIALGHALASTLRAAGARVARQTQIADFGPAMSEAMAGYMRFADSADPATTGEKSDTFVGRLHQMQSRDPHGEADLPETLLRGLISGDSEIRSLWLTIRDWAVSGQNETLARLGVHFERTIFDSQYAPRIEPLVRLAFAQGVVSGSPQGPLRFEIEGAGRESLLLVSENGQPTRDLRALTVWRSLMTEMVDVTLVRLTSEERRDNLDEILHGLAPGSRVYPTAVLHAEVQTDRDDGPGGESTLLIDDLLDMLMKHEELQELALEERTSCAAEDLAPMILMGMCLDHPCHEALTITPERVCDPDAHGGWMLARAWMKAWSLKNDAGPLPHSDDERRRTVVAQLELVPIMGRAVKSLDVLRLVRWLTHLSRWYLDSETDPATGRIMRAVLGSGLGCLGLVRPTEMNG